MPIKLSSPSHNHLFAFQIISWGFRYVCVPAFWSWTSAVCFESTSRNFKRRHVISIFYRQWFGLELHNRVLPCEFQSRKRFFQAPKNKPLVSPMEKFKPSKIAKYSSQGEVFQILESDDQSRWICMDDVGCVVGTVVVLSLREVNKTCFEMKLRFCCKASARVSCSSSLDSKSNSGFLCNTQTVQYCAKYGSKHPCRAQELGEYRP